MLKTLRKTARAAVEGGADMLSLVNTFTAMSIDINKKAPAAGERDWRPVRPGN